MAIRVRGLELGDLDAALREYDRAIEAEPGNPSGYQYKANLLAWEIGDYDSAINEFHRCLEIEPVNPWCHLDLAWVYEDIGEIDAAVENFRLFIEHIDPQECPECVEEAQEYIDQNS